MRTRSVCVENLDDGAQGYSKLLGFCQAGVVNRSHSVSPLCANRIGGEMMTVGKGGTDEEGKDDDADESDEARIMKKRRSVPKAPTPQEKAEHEVTHLPYRSWCPVRVAARGTSDAHRRRREDDVTRPEVSYDFCFLRNEQHGDYAPVLVSKDRGPS